MPIIPNDLEKLPEFAHRQYITLYLVTQWNLCLVLPGYKRCNFQCPFNSCFMPLKINIVSGSGVTPRWPSQCSPTLISNATFPQIARAFHQLQLFSFPVLLALVGPWQIQSSLVSALVGTSSPGSHNPVCPWMPLPLLDSATKPLAPVLGTQYSIVDFKACMQLLVSLTFALSCLF